MRVTIVGGGGAASNAANIIRRLDKDACIDIFTDRPEIGTQPCEIPFVLSGRLPSWNDTFVFRKKFYDERNISVHFDTRVTSIDRSEKRLTAGTESHEYDKLILDLGAVPTIPPIPGVDGNSEYVLATNLRTARAFEEAVKQHSTAAIVGTGQIALEVASLLKARDYERVHLLGRSDRLLRAYLDPEMAQRIEGRASDAGIDVILSAGIQGIGSRNGRKTVSLEDQELEVDLLFFATGTEPNVALAREAGLVIGESGGIQVNEYFQTSDPDVYSIGDCTETWDAILGLKRVSQTATGAARAGRIAATNLVLGNVLPYHGTALAFIMDAFGYQVGTVGYTEEYALGRKMDVVSIVIGTATRRRSFGGKSIYIKLIADRQTEALVGAQLISEEEVAGKIDRLAVAVAEKVPFRKLALMDTCYHPTTGTAYEPVIMALDELRLKFDNVI
jgi:NADH oxidase (H2O2-forming)